MVLWSRLRQSRFKFHAFSNGYRRFHNVNPASVRANEHISSRNLAPISNYPKFIAQEEQLVLFRQVRFFARAIKIQKVQRDDDEPRLNEEITAPMLRLVVDEENHFIITREEALARARKLDMDLVEVSKIGNPPVVKIFDYNKQKYIQQTREKERAKSKITLKAGPPKDVIFRGKISENDLKVKAAMVIKLMEKGHRVKCVAQDKDEGVDLKGLLIKFTALIEDVAVEVGEPMYEATQAFVIFRHIKFGPPKKGKKASASASSASPSSSASTDSDSQETTKSDWATFDDGGEDPIFKIEDGETGQRLEASMEKETTYSDPRPASSTISSKPNLPNRTRVVLNTLHKPGPGPRVEAPARGIPKQDSPEPTPPKTYGIFSTPKVNGATNTTNTRPTFPNQGRLGNNASPQTRPEAPSPPKSFGMFSTPKVNSATNTPPSFQNQGRPGNYASPQTRPKPSGRGIPKQDSQNTTAPKSFGIFSAPKVDAGDSRVKGGENPGQAKYGIFSGGDKENQAQRR